MIQALGDRILVDPHMDLDEYVSASGVVMPHLDRHGAQMGTVVSAGPRVGLFKLGDLVYFGRHTGLEVKDGHKVFMIMRESEVTAKQ